MSRLKKHHHQQQQQQQHHQESLKQNAAHANGHGPVKANNPAPIGGRLEAVEQQHSSRANGVGHGRGGSPKSNGHQQAEPPADASNGSKWADGLHEDQNEENNNNNSNNNDDDKIAAERREEYKAEWVWLNIFLFVVLHSSIPVGLYLAWTQRPWLTIAWSLFGIYASAIGVTGGTHRLWSHRSYRASLPVELLLMVLQTMAGQNSIYTWSRDHRVHHKFAETDADPHNIKRGFFFAHMGWLCCRKHPEVKAKGRLIDMSDLAANRVVMFQHRNFWWLSLVCNLLAPTLVPVLLWRERLWTAFVFAFMIRYLVTLHGTWLVNSAAHYHGSRPYDARMEARESPLVIANLLGEGFHNYHHAFPYDYSTSEFGKYMNLTTGFIDLCAALGLVSGRRKVDQATILRRQLRTGDHTGALERRGHLLRPNGVATSSSSSMQAADQQEENTQRPHDTQLAAASASESSEQQPESEPESELASHQRARLRAGGKNGPTTRSAFELASARMADNQLVNNIIHELPYISGLTSLKYTM